MRRPTIALQTTRLVVLDSEVRRVIHAVPGFATPVSVPSRERSRSTVKVDRFIRS